MYETTLTVVGRVATTVTQVTFNDGGPEGELPARQHGSGGSTATSRRGSMGRSSSWAWSAGATSQIG